jgi:hypothetical protein
MGTSEEAEQAVSRLNGRDLGGRSLKVEIAKPKASTGGSRGGAGGRGGFRSSRW